MAEWQTAESFPAMLRLGPSASSTKTAKMAPLVCIEGREWSNLLTPGTATLARTFHMNAAPTSGLVNIPEIRFPNLFDEDPLGLEFWKCWLGAARFSELRGHFSALGESGAIATELSARADKQGPALETYDPRGMRIDRVRFHPDYRELEQLSYGRGIVQIKYDAQFLARHRAFRHLVGFGAGYYFAQSEIGLYCPICMIDGVGRVLGRRPEGPPAAAPPPCTSSSPARW